MKAFPKINREISWLSFNQRVLQEAQDKSVPLFERLTFLGIHSNNMDEFFRVRVGTLNRLLSLGKKGEDGYEDNVRKVIKLITNKAQRISLEFDQTFNTLINELNAEGILIVNETQLNKKQFDFVEQYFEEKLKPSIGPVMIDQIKKFPNLRDKSIYLATKIVTNKRTRYALIEVPSSVHSRFIVLPDKGTKKCVMFLEDLIRASIKKLFPNLTIKEASSFVFKITRDAELDIDNDISPSFIETMSKSLNQRKKGLPTRFVYDNEMPLDLLDLLRSKIKLKSRDYEIASGRYHNLKDLMQFPVLGRTDLKRIKHVPVLSKDLNPEKSLISQIKKKDVLLTFPFQTFNYFINLIREASIDPKVNSISITIYRLAKNSQVANALMMAAMNEKKVNVVIELMARFDEEANISWARKFEEAGVNISYGVSNYKVHSKLLQIERVEEGKKHFYTCIGTGNFNESTARVYSDHLLLTSDPYIGKEVGQVFKMIYNFQPEKTEGFKTLWVSPQGLRKKFVEGVDKQINLAHSGEKAELFIKVNNLVDEKIILKLYEASNAGVKVKLIVRGVCCLVPGVKEFSENIEAISIVDQFLEHSRIFVFGKGKNAEVVISSADLMHRNLNNRVEVAVPIKNLKLKSEIRKYLEIQWADNVKARSLEGEQVNNYLLNDKQKLRSQAFLFHQFQTE